MKRTRGLRSAVSMQLGQARSLDLLVQRLRCSFDAYLGIDIGSVSTNLDTNSPKAIVASAR